MKIYFITKFDIFCSVSGVLLRLLNLYPILFLTNISLREGKRKISFLFIIYWYFNKYCISEKYFSVVEICGNISKATN